jgi:pseudaminic acid synthase
MNKKIIIAGKEISNEAKTFIIAEMSANHMQDYNRAIQIIDAAKYAGADAIKFQTYTPDTITLDCDNKYFQITQGTIWDGTTLHKLYKTAYTPWEWQPKLKKYAEELGLICFSSPFDMTSIDFLEEMEIPAYKIASFENNDIPFIKKIASLKKPIIISTGIAREEDIELALKTCIEAGNENVILLKCTSAYPSPYDQINLKMIPDMAEKFNVLVGLSDHTLGNAVAVGSISLGAKIVEKHLTLKRSDGGPDGAFSMEPDEFKEMVTNIRIVETALGKVSYELTNKQEKSREHSRSLFVVEDIEKGECLTENNIRSIRPGFGMQPKYYDEILGKKVNQTLKKGTPLNWEYIIGDK